MAKKLSTEEILKAARAQSGKGGDASQAPAEPPAASAPQPPAEEATQPPVVSASTPAAPASAGTKPAAAPKSTKDILAAARAQTAATASTSEAAAVPGGGAPKSTKDILAAARAQTGSNAPAPAGGAKSTKDILAAARAQTQAGGTTPAAAKPAVEKPAAKAASAAAAKPAGARPSVQEMLKVAREGKPVDEPAVAKPASAKPAAAALVIPQKPAPAVKKPEIDSEPRRGFLAKLGTGLAASVWVLFGTPFRAAWTTFAATSGLWGFETARFMMPNVLVEPPSKFKVGPTSDYPPAAVSTKWTAQYGVWLVHNEYKGKDIIYALLTVCTHLGCTPNWLEGERKFKCPCHGSGFYITGVNFEGPAPRPLERMAIRVSDDGSLEVDKSRKFQEELGQWNDPASYVPVA
ncbi:MAG TPA: ubiquinol-cytochrome c reductase iron-sulfur subunit [Planctomycetaceae bacterium]|jgi:cytochrome b6-f complex iron-sulfur subunit|nr:ubiquinol-cytochrome c reductase iron-sulfur subunit [Planctomycetaceae bacterium]